MIDGLSSRIKSTQYRTTDWRNGIFIDDLAGGNWDGWGQMQIYALARDYRLKIDLGQNPADPAVASLLDYAAYGADNFYGIEAYHYAAPGTDNVPHQRADQFHLCLVGAVSNQLHSDRL